MAKGDWWFKFEYRKWEDPLLRRCSLETQGFWLKVYAEMRERDVCEVSGTPEEFARLYGCTVDEIVRSIVDLDRTKAADVTGCNAENVTCNSNVTLVSRERRAALSNREKTRLRVERYRRNKPVTGQSKSKSKSKSKKEEEKSATAKPKSSPEDWLEKLRTEAIYSHIDFDREFRKSEIWLEDNAPNRKMSKKYFTNWLNRIPVPDVPVYDGPPIQKLQYFDLPDMGPAKLVDEELPEGLC